MLTIEETSIADFGTIVTNGEAGEVYVDISLGIGSDNPNYVFFGSNSSPMFRITGDPNAYVDINTNAHELRGESVDLVKSGGEPIKFSVIQGTGYPDYEVLGADGFLTIPIAGINKINANQAVGVYTGTYIMTVNYD